VAGVVGSDGTVLTLAAAREHLRIGSQPLDAGLIAAAEGRIEAFLGRELVGATGWAAADEVPALVIHCVKLALSDLFVNREAPELTDDQLRPMIGRHMVITLG
jgi:hypothetical protein